MVSFAKFTRIAMNWYYRNGMGPPSPHGGPQQQRSIPPPSEMPAPVEYYYPHMLLGQSTTQANAKQPIVPSPRSAFSKYEKVPIAPLSESERNDINNSVSDTAA